MEIHLDLLGGLAGDMFIAALLDAFPQHEAAVREAVAGFGAGTIRCALHPHRDERLRGSRFEVALAAHGAPLLASGPAHEHATWKSLREQITRASLPADVRRHALGIFSLLAEAEAAVHGVPVDEVTFHEVGAWDSIADVVGASVLIERLGVSRWSVSAIPLGTGRIATAHGTMPVPAPATAQLLLGMTTVEDGVAGERITPTGAALLRYLCPPDARSASPGIRVLTATGTGFGSRVIAGISNCVRALCFTPTEHVHPEENRRIDLVEFEVDDQSGEELALGLDRLRAHPGVLDLTQSAVMGKRGRMMSHIQILIRPHHLDEVIERCFRETTTIGLRHQVVRGIGLQRAPATATVDGLELRVKVVERPGGRTAKAEAEDVRSHADHARRAHLRAQAERSVLERAETPADA